MNVVVVACPSCWMVVGQGEPCFYCGADVPAINKERTTNTAACRSADGKV